MTSQWVTDQLYSILGFAEKHVVDFIIGLAQESSSAHSLLEELEAFEVPRNERTLQFAQELLSRVPPKPRANQGSSRNASRVCVCVCVCVFVCVCISCWTGSVCGVCRELFVSVSSPL